jgi:hypothetical protein
VAVSFRAYGWRRIGALRFRYGHFRVRLDGCFVTRCDNRPDAWLNERGRGKAMLHNHCIGYLVKRKLLFLIMEDRKRYVFVPKGYPEARRSTAFISTSLRQEFFRQ